MSASETLAAIDAAILDILQNGQEVMVAGNRYTAANLDDLRKLRSEFAALTGAEARPGILDRAVAGTVRRY